MFNKTSTTSNKNFFIIYRNKDKKGIFIKSTIKSVNIKYVNIEKIS